MSTPGEAPGRLVRWLVGLNLRAKLMLMSTSISIVCFLVATSVLVTGEFWAMRDALLARAQALTETVAANSEAALSFDDREGAEILLATVLSEPLVTEARLIVPEPGTQQIAAVPFARVARNSNTMLPITVSRSEGHRFDGSMLQVIRPVTSGEDALGWVFIRLELTLLEELLGVTVFLRDARQVTLTGEGERLLPYARRLLALNREAVSKFVVPDISGVVRVGSPDDYGERILPPVLKRFAQTHPSVAVDVVIDQSVNLRKRFQAGQLDIAILTCPPGAAMQCTSRR